MGLRAVGYFREDPSARGGCLTLAEQNQRFLDFCRRESYDVAATFLDGQGKGDGRPGYHQMLDYLRHRPDGVVVVVANLECLGRDMHQVARSYFQLVGLGVQLACISGEPEDPTTALLKQWNARDESERTGERVRAAMRRKAVKGEVLGRPPYGYKVGLRHRLEVISEEAAVVRYIYRMYIQEGLGIRLIARRLNEEGFRTRRDGNWSMVTIRDILRNRAYLGTYARFGVRVPGSHQALIAPDDFRRAQDRMAARRTSSGPRSVKAFLLSGLIYCGACGNRMIGVSRRQSWTRRSDGGTSSAEYRYYQCGSRTNQSVCSYHTRRVDDLDEDVRAATIIALERSLAGATQDGSHANTLDAPATLRARLRNLEREFDRAMEQAAGGQISRERLQALSVEITQRQLELEALLGESERRDRDREAHVEHRHARAVALDTLRHAWNDLPFDERRGLLREVLDRVTVYDDRVEPALRD